MTSRSVSKSAAAAGSLLALVTLGGCVVDGPAPAYRISPPTGIEGNWRSADGIYTASFLNQTTTWTAVDNGAVLIRGTYLRTAQDDYSLQLHSIRSGADRQANCRVHMNSQLNCIYADGTRFQMFRISGAPVG
ncbi:MAG: hypothetical protein Kow0026_18860 [Oricola sp.]